jgi:thioredoxin reductase (NADPH)
MAAGELFDLVIIGGGPGGLTAGLYAMRAALKTVLLDKGIPGGQINLTKDVENYPGFEKIMGFDLSEKLLLHAQAYGLEVRQAEVVAVEPGLAYHSVRLANGATISTLAVVLATGGSPRKLGIPGELEYYGRGVSYCATCDGFFFRDKNVVVVGGGDTALEESLYLAKISCRVYLAHRRDAFRGSRILQERVMAEANIEILWNTIVTEILANDQGVRGAALRDTRTGAFRELAVDGVFIFIGFVPNNHLVPAGVRMDHDGFVETDEKCETNLPGIFVIGDLRLKHSRQIVTAAADGCTAALAAALGVEIKKAVQSCPGQ